MFEEVNGTSYMVRYDCSIGLAIYIHIGLSFLN